MAKFGKSNPNGSTITEATECVLTGIPVDHDNSVREKVTGTPYFWRVIGHQYHRVTDELREWWAEQAKANPDAKWDANTVFPKPPEPAKPTPAPKVIKNEVKE